jgi:hypothetical protein
MPKNTSMPGITQRRHVRRISVSSFPRNAPKPVIAPASDELHEHVFQTRLSDLEPSECHAGGRDRRRDLPLRAREIRYGQVQCASVGLDRLEPGASGECARHGGGRDAVFHFHDQAVGGRTGGELLNPGACHDAAALEDRHCVAHALDVGQDVRGEEHGRASTQRRDHLQHLTAAYRVERARRLVEHEQARRIDQRLRDAKPLLHPSGEPADARRDRGETRHLQQRGRPRVQCRLVEPKESSGELQVLAGGHPRVEARHVGQEADPRADRVGRTFDVMTEDVGGAGRGTSEPREDAERGRLASSVSPEEAEDHAGTDNEIDAVERDGVAEPLGEAAQLDGGRLVRSNDGQRWSRGPYSASTARRADSPPAVLAPDAPAGISTSAGARPTAR